MDAVAFAPVGEYRHKMLTWRNGKVFAVTGGVTSSCCRLGTAYGAGRRTPCSNTSDRPVQRAVHLFGQNRGNTYLGDRF